jgi:hypothetical protein
MDNIMDYDKYEALEFLESITEEPYPQVQEPNLLNWYGQGHPNGELCTCVEKEFYGCLYEHPF